MSGPRLMQTASTLTYMSGVLLKAFETAIISKGGLHSWSKKSREAKESEFPRRPAPRVVINADCLSPQEPHPDYCSRAVFGRFLSIKRRGAMVMIYSHNK